MNLTFIINTKNGRSKFEDKVGFANYVQSLGDGVIEVVAKKRRRIRSTGKPWEEGNQNGYYWAVVLPLSAKELGYTSDEMHEVFISEFAPIVYKDFGNKRVPVKIRTSEMNTFQFKEYVESIQIKIAELGVVIPDPQKIAKI